MTEELREPRGYRVKQRVNDGRWIAVNQDTGDVEVFVGREEARQWAGKRNRLLNR